MSLRFSFLLLFFLSFASVYAENPEILLSPSDDQVKASLDIVDTLTQDHFREIHLNDELSVDLLNNYLDLIDPSRSYFSSSDVKDFERWRYQLDDFLRQGDLKAAFTIYNRYLNLAKERYTSNIAILESDTKFDLTREDELLIDRDEMPWLATRQELDDYWKKRLTDALLRLNLTDKSIEESRELVIKRYKNLITRLEQRNSDDVFEVYMNALTTLYDPHTTYMSPHTLDNFKISLSLSLEGIGAVLQTNDEYTEIVRIIKGGPADRQGILQPEDKIISVAQGDEAPVEVIGWRLDEVVEMIRGPKGTVVNLEILSAGSTTPKLVALERDKIKLEEQSAKSEVIQIPNPKGEDFQFGVISVPAFYLDIDAVYRRDPDYKSTSRDVLALIESLEQQSVDGIILDLRNNGGGYLTEATALTDLFVDPGPVVQIKNTHQRISRSQRARRPARYKGPLVVLINRLSASASEITAGALQDYGRALIIGDTSFGKGTVQARRAVSDGELKITESKFYRISGESTQNKGVVPDISLPTFFDYEEFGESSYDRALPWDTIHSAPHRTYSDFSKVIPLLSKSHQKRLLTDPDLQHLNQLAEYNLNRRQINTLSLNIDYRKQENDKQDAELLAFENARRVHKGLEPYPDKEAWKEATKDRDALPLPIRDPLLYEAGNIFADLIALDTSLARAD